MPSAPLKVVSAALHVSILIYLVVIFVLSKGEGWTLAWSIRPGNEILVYVLTGAAFINGMIAVYAPRLFKDPKARVSGVPGQEEPLFFDFSQPTITPRIQTATILRMAFAESVAIFGLILAILNQSVAVIVPYVAAGLLLQIAVGAFGRFLIPR